MQNPDHFLSTSDFFLLLLLFYVCVCVVRFVLLNNSLLGGLFFIEPNYFYHSCVVLQNRFDYDGHLIVCFPIGIQILWSNDVRTNEHHHIAIYQSISHRTITNPTETVVAAAAAAATISSSSLSSAQLVIHAFSVPYCSI